MTSTKYACLLRGINVGGHKLMKMERLRDCLESLGLEKVKTYLQSGNVVFEAPGTTAEKVAKGIGKQIHHDFGFTVPILVLTKEEVNAAIVKNPFAGEEGIDPATLHVTFLAEAASEEGQKKAAGIKAGPDRFRVVGKLLYLHCPGGYGNTKLSNQALEKALKVEATTRNWKTVNELERLLAED